MLPQRSAGEPPLFLINPRGYLFQELTASSLIVCDLDGRVLRGKGELRKVAFHIHARLHLKKPNAACIVHVHPQYLTALALLEDPSFALSHHNNLFLNDRIVYDTWATAPVDDNAEGDRIADADGRQDHHGDGRARRDGGRRDGARGVRRVLHGRADLHVSDDRDGDRAEAAASAGELTSGVDRTVGREDRCADAPGCVAAHPGSRGS